jgi:primosomal protein N''
MHRARHPRDTLAYRRQKARGDVAILHGVIEPCQRDLPARDTADRQALADRIAFAELRLARARRSIARLEARLAIERAQVLLDVLGTG